MLQSLVIYLDILLQLKLLREGTLSSTLCG